MTKENTGKPSVNGKERCDKAVKSETFLAYNKKFPDAELEKFKAVIQKKHNLQFDSYWDLHQWSVTNTEIFWDEAWKFLKIVSSKPYDKAFVKSGPGFMDNVWFRGAAFNFAENILRVRDDTTAISYSDFEGNTESLTFKELFEEVRLYAAAFRKYGLKKGDVVACYMSNRKEAVIAMLAINSVGAIWSGAHPFYGAKVAAKLMKRLDPKFVIAVDRFSFQDEERDIADRLPIALENIPSSLVKVIIVPTKKETYSRNFSHIKNSILLPDFLKSGKSPDGRVPAMVFEQVASDHTVIVNFTSGTTGDPKGIVHSTASFVSTFVHFSLHMNITHGDTLFSHYQMGWVLWYHMLNCLGLGARLCMFEGFPLYKKEGIDNYWDIVAKNKTTHIALVPIVTEDSERLEIFPSGKYDFKDLKMVMLGGSSIKKQNIEFFHKYISKDIFVSNAYGCTESMEYLTGFDWNMPYYAPETQVMSLGMDIKCFDSNGKPVVGKRGEIVFATPTPSLPVFLWKDEGNVILNENYLSKYPGVWCQSDEGYINPITKSLVALGRSDHTMTQNGERFLPSDIYFAIQGLEELDDFLCVPQKKQNGHDRAVLFVKLKSGFIFTKDLKKKIEKKIEKELWLHLIPEVILPITDIPYNQNGKKMESIVKKIIATNSIPESSNIINPECLAQFCDIPEIVNFDK